MVVETAQNTKHEGMNQFDNTDASFILTLAMLISPYPQYSILGAVQHELLCTA